MSAQEGKTGHAPQMVGRPNLTHSRRWSACPALLVNAQTSIGQSGLTQPVKKVIGILRASVR